MPYKKNVRKLLEGKERKKAVPWATIREPENTEIRTELVEILERMDVAHHPIVARKATPPQWFEAYEAFYGYANNRQRRNERKGCVLQFSKNVRKKLWASVEENHNMAVGGVVAPSKADSASLESKCDKVPPPPSVPNKESGAVLNGAKSRSNSGEGHATGGTEPPMVEVANDQVSSPCYGTCDQSSLTQMMANGGKNNSEMELIDGCGVPDKEEEEDSQLDVRDAKQGDVVPTWIRKDEVNPTRPTEQETPVATTTAQNGKTTLTINALQQNSRTESQPHIVNAVDANADNSNDTGMVHDNNHVAKKADAASMERHQGKNACKKRRAERLQPAMDMFHKHRAAVAKTVVNNNGKMLENTNGKENPSPLVDSSNDISVAQSSGTKHLLVQETDRPLKMPRHNSTPLLAMIGQPAAPKVVFANNIKTLPSPLVDKSNVCVVAQASKTECRPVQDLDHSSKTVKHGEEAAKVIHEEAQVKVKQEGDNLNKTGNERKVSVKIESE